MKRAKFQLKDIRPNPYNHAPRNLTVIERLKESIETTGFWGGLVARQGENGKPELEFGHHRLEALKLIYPLTHEVEVSIIEDSDTAASIQRMARENYARKQGGMATVISDVRATVEALGVGTITEEKIPAPSSKVPKASIRYAPSFIPGKVPETGTRSPYTAASLARFLGLTKADKNGKDGVQPDYAVIVALDALELIEQAAMTDDVAIDHETGEELGPKQLAQKIQAKRDAIRAAGRRQREAEEARKRQEEYKRQQAEAERQRRELEARLKKEAEELTKREAERIRKEREERRKVAEEAKAKAAVEGVTAKKAENEATKLKQQAADVPVEKPQGARAAGLPQPIHKLDSRRMKAYTTHFNYVFGSWTDRRSGFRHNGPLLCDVIEVENHITDPSDEDFDALITAMREHSTRVTETATRLVNARKKAKAKAAAAK